MKTEEREKVIFRFWQGDVIALFLEIASDPSPYHCTSYMHMGQHASADPVLVIQNSRSATPREFRPLLWELESRGYRPDIRHRLPRDAIETRRKQLTLVTR